MSKLHELKYILSEEDIITLKRNLRIRGIHEVFIDDVEVKKVSHFENFEGHGYRCLVTWRSKSNIKPSYYVETFYKEPEEAETILDLKFDNNPETGLAFDMKTLHGTIKKITSLWSKK